MIGMELPKLMPRRSERPNGAQDYEPAVQESSTVVDDVQCNPQKGDSFSNKSRHFRNNHILMHTYHLAPDDLLIWEKSPKII